jgi:hypothetical protein
MLLSASQQHTLLYFIKAFENCQCIFLVPTSWHISGFPRYPSEKRPAATSAFHKSFLKIQESKFKREQQRAQTRGCQKLMGKYKSVPYVAAKYSKIKIILKG